jgi:hypothetical protein
MDLLYLHKIVIQKYLYHTQMGVNLENPPSLEFQSKFFRCWQYTAV